MRRMLRALALSLVPMLAGSAALADNWTVKDSTGATVTLGSKAVNGVQFQQHQLVDPAGAAYASGNPLPVGIIGSIPAGSALIGTVGISGTPAVTQSGTWTVGVNALPALPAGANAIGTVGVTALPALPAGANAIGTVGVSNFPATQAVSAAALPLPTGAATAAKQPALGTAGTPSSDVLTVQGATGGKALPTDTVVQSTSTDRGGTITAGGTAQTFMAANTSRRGFVVQNQSTGDLYVNCTATATVDYHSLKVPAGSFYESSNIHVGTGACSIIGATTAQAFYAREF